MKKEEKYEVCATVPNLLSFFQAYFPKLNVDYSKVEPMTL
jgi:hypothetical protein